MEILKGMFDDLILLVWYCQFKLRRKLDKKIYPFEPILEGIADHNNAAADEDAQDASGMELLLEPSLEKEFTYQDLQLLTDNFSRVSSHTQFGKLYLGRIPDGWKGMKAQDVTVKMWNQETGFRAVNWETLVRRAKPNDALNRMATEINFLSQPEMESHPNLATVMGYCFEENKLGVVYNIEPRNTVRRFAEKGCFTWARRMKVALGLARLLEFLHGHQPQFLVRNLAAAHIMLDKDWNPILVDLSMIVGGGFGDTREASMGSPIGSRGYFDFDVANSDEWTEKSDVFAFGVILLELIFKCRFDGEKCRGYKLGVFGPVIYKAFVLKHGESNCSFANEHNFGNDRTFDDSDGQGPMISKLAIQCLNKYPGPRPTMTEIIGVLEKLQVCKDSEIVESESKEGAAMDEWAKNGQ